MAEAYVPTSDEFRPLVLKALVGGDQLSRRELVERVADLANLSDKARSQRLASGTERYVNRIGWAMSALAIGGLVDRPKRGFYQITQNGRTVASKNLATYSEKEMLEWPAWQQYQDELSARRQQSDAVSSAALDDADPIDTVESLVQEFNRKTEADLLRRLQEGSPEFFERAVLKLLGAMGYGGSRADLVHTGRSGDGGIDGAINQDALGLSKIYVQAKRYADGNNVQSPAVQQFIGALDGQRAAHGVLITTSAFSSGAKKTASFAASQRVRLIDGIELTKLMLEYGVAVQPRSKYTFFDVDEDFFDEDSDF